MTDRTTDEATLRQWIGRTIEREDVISVEPARRMQATLDRKPSFANGDPLPPLWTWFYFLDVYPDSELERDGRTVLGDFLPPVALPRRMWAGGRFRFSGNLTIGEAASRRSEIVNIRVKEGRTGTLCFISAKHAYNQRGASVIEEEHDMVYRADPSSGDLKPEPPPTPSGAEISRAVTPSELMLFRYSALTFNGHRIHYDREYAQTVEGYPNLVFHGPLTATLLADLAVEHGGRMLKSFDYRAISPLYDDQPFTIHVKKNSDGGLELWAANPDGRLSMTATAT